MSLFPLKEARWGKDRGLGGKETPLRASQGGVLPPRTPPKQRADSITGPVAACGDGAFTVSPQA